MTTWSPGADLFHHARTFVTEDHRQWRFELLVADDHVGVADASRDHAHEHLVVAWCFERCGFELQWFAGFAGDSGTDGLALLGVCVIRHFRFLLLVGRRQLGWLVPPRCVL
jgi:hypothetical protein